MVLLSPGITGDNHITVKQLNRLVKTKLRGQCRSSPWQKIIFSINYSKSSLGSQTIVNGKTPIDYYSNFVSTLGATVSEVQTENTAQNATVTQLQTQNAALSAESER